MNLKPTFPIRAILSTALLLSLAGCGNKGPLMLPQSAPPAQPDTLPAMPSVGDMIQPTEPVPTDAAPAKAAPTGDGGDAATDVPPAPPPAAGDDGDG